jgi:hypothetical protein
MPDVQTKRNLGGVTKKCVVEQSPKDSREWQGAKLNGD